MTSERDEPTRPTFDFGGQTVLGNQYVAGRDQHVQQADTINNFFGGGPVGLGSYQLPDDIGDFTGREAEVNKLCARLHDSRGTSCIAGMPGVGKSTLAIHVAHLVGARFSDGTL